MLFAALAVLVWTPPLAAQQLDGRIVVYGRVEDAASRGPVEGAQVLAVDSSAVVYTDSLGAFGISLPAEGSVSVKVERLGYFSREFELTDYAQGRFSVLLLERAPIPMEGITAEVEQPLTELLDHLEARRNAYPGAMNAFDQTDLNRFALGGSVSDFLELRVPRLAPCRDDAFRVCVPGRGRTFRDLSPERSVIICLDGRLAFFDELEGLSVYSVALVEVYGGSIRPSRISVYTGDYMVGRARRGHTMVIPFTSPRIC